MPHADTLTLAVQCVNRQEFDEAAKLCDQVIQEAPQTARAWHLLGIICAQLGEMDDAVSRFQRATECDPANALYHYNLGLAYRSLGQLESAVEAYREAIVNQENLLEAHNNLGNTLIQLNQNEQAIHCFREMLRLFPESSVGHFNLANLLQDTGNYDESLPYYRRALELDATFSAARENLGRALVDAGCIAEAQQVWQEWLAHDPENAMARHMLAAASGENIPERCDDEFIREAFNEEFAEGFDEQLARLNYRAPSLIVDALSASDRNLSDLETLDAGCGTGLCGPLVKPWSRRLVGIDLSEDMLAKARQRGIYDALVADDIGKYMSAHEQSCDLIISADTLCYFGDLGQVLRSAAACLRAGGRLAFTVESAVGVEEPDYQLGHHGRYSHTESYLTRSLNSAGLSILQLSHNSLRTERGRPVAGMVVIAVKDLRA